MDFDIDSFLNETFKKVEKKEKKKVNNDDNNLNNSIKRENNPTNLNNTKNNGAAQNKNIANSIPKPNQLNHKNLNSIVKNKFNTCEKNNLAILNSLPVNNNIPMNISGENNKPDIKLLSKKTQRIIQEKQNIIYNKDKDTNNSKDSQKFNPDLNIDKTNTLNKFETTKYEEDKKAEYQNIVTNFKYDYDENIDVLDNDIYKNLSNMLSTTFYNRNSKNIQKENNEKLSDILLPLFPNEKVFYSEFNSDKIFLLDKFIAKGDSKAKKKQKNKASHQREEEGLDNDYLTYKKDYKKEKESKTIKKLKLDNSLDYSQLEMSMNKLWKSYIQILLNKAQSFDTIYSKMVKADLHGAILKVFDSTNKHFVGVEGINLLETKRTFCLLDKKNKIKTILKKGTIFSLDISFAYNDLGSESFKSTNNKMDAQNNQSKIPSISEVNATPNPNIPLDKIPANNTLPIIIKIIGDNFMYKSSVRTKAKFKNRYVLNNRG